MKKLYKFILWFLFISFVVGGMASTLGIEETLEQRLQADLQVSESFSVILAAAFEDVGIENYERIIHDPLLDNAHELSEEGFRIKTPSADNVILYLKEEGNFIKIKYANAPLFADGKVLDKIENNVLSDDQKADLQMQTREIVKQLLAFPDTASFPLIDGWKYAIIDGESIVQGYVDSENAYKQSIRVEFQAKYKAGALTSLILDNKEYVKK